MNFPVLMYHSVPSSGPGGRLAVPYRLLDRQWRALMEEGWILRGLTEALTIWRVDKTARIVGLTFDDGYADLLRVLDLLAKHKARATAYIPTSHPEQYRISGKSDPHWLSWSQISSLPPDMVEVGSHAHLHRPLDVLRQEDLDHEISYSRSMLAARAGVETISFCYPNGYSSPRVRRAVSAAGYANACIVGRQLADPHGDPYKVPRLQVTSEHDEAGIVSLARSGEPGLVPPLKRVAYPAWRVVRRTVYHATGHIVT